MIKPIVHDPMFLAQKSTEATFMDLQTAKDLLDTLAANRAGCVGLAANMIGVKKRIIVFDNNGTDTVMFNPEIIKQADPYQTEEGCLSLTGVRPCTRYETIEVEYFDQHFNRYTRTFNGFVAQIIQHEIDHCNGILI